METFLALLNVAFSSAIVIGVAINWKRFDDLNCLERVGYSGMAMFCGAIVIKAGFMLSLQEFRSDMFGILFRGAFLTYLAGNTYRHYRRTFTDIWTREDRAMAPRQEVHC